MVTDFSARALPIGVKFCMAVRPDLTQIFSYFVGDSPRDGRILGINKTPYGGICFLLKHFLCFFASLRQFLRVLHEKFLSSS